MTELELRDEDYVADGAGGLRRVTGDAALLQRVLFRLTARRGTFPFWETLGSRLWQLGRVSPAGRQAAARQYVAEALAEEPVQVDKVVGQVDILPTLSNLLGLEYDSRMMAGKDALSDSEGLVVFSSRCWMSDRGFYNSFTKTFTPAEGVSMTQEEQDSYVSSMRTLVGYQLSSTEMIVENDFYNVLFGAG